MPHITAVADQLIATDLPIIFLDTCILLDVIRAIKRRYTNCVAKARELHAAVGLRFTTNLPWGFHDVTH